MVFQCKNFIILSGIKNLKMKYIAILAFVVLLSSCQKKPIKKFDKIEKMNWLIGYWELKLNEGLLIESWTKANDSVFIGKSYFIKGSDTIHSEKIQLTQLKDDLFYSPTVVGQNNDKAVDFKLTSKNETLFVFENPAHDYPQKISYNIENTTSFTATISGKMQGKLNEEKFTMKKLNH